MYAEKEAKSQNYVGKPSSANDISQIEPTIFSPKTSIVQGQQGYVGNHHDVAPQPSIQPMPSNNQFQQQAAFSTLSQPFYAPPQPAQVQASMQRQPIATTLAALVQRTPLPSAQFTSIAPVAQPAVQPIQQIRPVAASPTQPMLSQPRPSAPIPNYSEYEKTMVNKYMNNMSQSMLPMGMNAARTITPNASCTPSFYSVFILI